MLKDRLRELRKEHGYTQEQLSKVLNISASAYGFYELGRNEPSVDGLKKLAKEYNVSIGYIVGETEYRNPYAVEESKLLKFNNLTEQEELYLNEQLNLFRKLKDNSAFN